MNISVIVIAYNEEKNIVECIKSLLSQHYSGNFEVIVVDGKSTDKTIPNVSSFSRRHDNIRLIVKKSSITEARNIGIKSARYPYIAFTDADCIVPKDWLAVLSQQYIVLKKEHKNLAGVGGANIPPKNINNFTFAIGIAFDSFIGSLGSIQAKRFESNKPAFSISCTNSLYEKKRLESVGLFSEDLGNQGEDWDMGLKLRKKGFVVYGLKDSYVTHKMRTTPKRFWKNMVFYGDGRMRLFRKYPKDNSLKYFLPFVFIVVMAFSVLSFYSPIFLISLLYFPFIFLYSVFLCAKRHEPGYISHVFLVFLILHFGYSIGELKGLRWLFK